MKLKRSFAVVSLGTAAMLLAACGAGGDPLGQGSAAPSGSGSASAAKPVVVGSANFGAEPKIIAEIYSQALKAKGVESSTKLGIGSREVYLQALEEGTVSIVPEYTGNLLLNYDKESTAKSAEEVEAALPKALPSTLKVLKSSPASDQDVYVVTKEFSEKNGVTSIGDLSKIAGGVRVGGFAELEKRTYGPPGLTKVYNVKVKEFQPYESVQLMADGLKANKTDVTDMYTTTSVIGQNQLVQLEDPEKMILPQNVIPLVRAEVADNTAVTSVLDTVQAALTTEDLAAMNDKVDVDHMDPDEVAAEWLKEKNLG